MDGKEGASDQAHGERTGAGLGGGRPPLGSARLIYFDAEMGDALTEALNGFAGDADVRGRSDNRPVAPRSRAAGCAGNRWRFI